MEGVLFIPSNRPKRFPGQICTECGRIFRPRRVGDGVEQLCDECYEAQFHSLRASSPEESALSQQWLDRDRKSTRLNSSHLKLSRMPSSA